MSKKAKTAKRKVKTARRKASSVRHTRAIQRERSQHPLVAPPPEQITARLTELILPATEAQQANAHQAFGLRLRDLTPVVMMALVLSLIWRQVGNISVGVRLLNSEGLLWATAMTVTQQAVSLRFGSLSADLFLRVLAAVLPLCQARWQARERPLPPELAWAQAHYTRVLACDGSTLDALVREITIDQLIELIGRLTHQAIAPLRNASGGGVKRLWANLGKAQALLGYTPRISLEDGLRLTLERDPRFRDLPHGIP